MALRGDRLVVKAGSVGSSPSNGIIAESTDCTFSISAEALESTSQSSGLNASYIPGKVSATVSGSFLLAATATNLTALFTYVNAGTAVEVSIEVDGTVKFDGNGVITSLETSGGLSDSLATGSYSIQCTGDMAV